MIFYLSILIPQYDLLWPGVELLLVRPGWDLVYRVQQENSKYTCSLHLLLLQVSLSSCQTCEVIQVAPDLPEVDRRDVAAVALRSGIDGLIVGNTTMRRPQLVADHPCGHEVCTGCVHVFVLALLDKQPKA